LLSWKFFERIAREIICALSLLDIYFIFVIRQRTEESTFSHLRAHLPKLSIFATVFGSGFAGLTGFKKIYKIFIHNGLYRTRSAS